MATTPAPVTANRLGPASPNPFHLNTVFPFTLDSGGDVELMGPVGSASIVKVITNMLAFVHLWASGEALMLAKRAGVDLDKAFHGIRISSGNSFAHETEGQLVLNGSYNVGFTMDLALKDMGLALGLGRATDTPLALAELVNGFFEQAQDASARGPGRRRW